MSTPTVATLDPQVISAGPIILPSQRRLMILLMLALAALLQVATSAWGPIGNGPDGMNAAIARELALGIPPAEIGQLWHQPIHATPVQWITAQSFRIFNINEMAARFPFAIANLLVVALIFLIAERIGGFWRGLASGIIAATMSGTILHGRDGGGSALTALIFTLSIYTAIRMLEQKSQIRWQIFYWCSVFGLLTLGKPTAAIINVASLWGVFVIFREARIRLRSPCWIIGSLFFIALLIYFFQHSPFTFPSLELNNVTKYFWILFPWSIVLFPPLFLRIRKVLRLHDITPAETLLWGLFVFGSFWGFFFSKNVEWPASISCQTPIFALLGSLVWERTSSSIRMVGVAVLVAIAISGMGYCGRVAGKEWLNLLQPIWWLSSSVIVVFGISAMVALHLRHSRAALLIIAASTIPLSYNLLDARARYDWQHTMKDLGKKVEIGYMPGTCIFVDDQLVNVSGFLFYSPPGLEVFPVLSGKNISAKANDYILVGREKISDWPKTEKIGSNRTHILLLPTK